MKVFIASSLCWAYHPEQVIIFAKDRGLQGVEMWAEHIYYHDANPQALRELAEQQEITLTLHASSWDLNICSLNQGIQQQSIAELKKSVDLASELNVLHMTMHPGRFTVKDYLFADHMNALIKNTSLLAAYAKQRQVILSIELMEPIPKEILTHPSTMNDFRKRISDQLYITLDIAHVPIAGNPIKYLEELQNVNSIHLSDSSHSQYHLPLGEGEIKLQQVLKKLSEIDLPVILEGMETSNALEVLNLHLSYLHQHGWIEGKN